MPVVQVRRKDDTLIPIAAILTRPGGRQIDLTGETVKFKMVDKDGTAIVALTTDRVTIHPTQTFTAAGGRLTAVEHKLADGLEVLLSTDGTLPSGLAAATRYFVVNTQRNSFQLSNAIGGNAISVTDAGSGTHSFAIVGSVQYGPLTANVNAGGKYYPYFVRVDGDALDHFPVAHRAFVQQITED